MTESTSFVVAGVATLLLAAAHLSVPTLRRSLRHHEPAAVSFGGGVAVAYVFLHLLPELAAGNREIGRLIGDVGDVTLLRETTTFLVAMVGLVVFYGLEHMARSRRRSGDDDRAAYWLHLGSYAAYNAVITYSLPLTIRAGLPFAVTFVVAMAVHFILTDRGLGEHYGDRYRRSGRFVVSGALIVGWVSAVIAAPTSTAVVSGMIALLGGAVLLNVFKEELPDDRDSRFPWFLAGAVAYGAVLLALTAMGPHDESDEQAGVVDPDAQLLMIS